MRASPCAAAALLVALAASAQAPTPVAERIVSHGHTTTRTSLFSNRTVVVSISEDGRQGVLRTLTLPEDQYFIYLGILERAARELGEEPVSSDIGTSRDRVELMLHIGPAAPRKLEFSPMAVVNLPLSQIAGALNDLETLTLSSSLSAEALRGWQPRRGDRVELLAGGFARVADVIDDGVVILVYEDTYIREIVPVGGLDKVVLRVVEPEP
jgi:hypothetical protein